MRHLLLLLPLVVAGCQSTPDDIEPIEEQVEPLVRAREAFQRGDLPTARDAVQEHLADDSDDVRARYLLARVLAAQGEFRAAKREVRTALLEERKDPLMWDLLAQVREELGEHRNALRAYQEVQRLVPDSVGPVLGQARCLMVLGEDRAALAVVNSSEPRIADDPWLHYIRFRAHQRLGEQQAAEAAARAFLKAPPQGAIDRVEELRGWLTDQGGRLDMEARQAALDFVREACRFRIPDSEPPEDKVLAEAPERFFVYDDRPVFVTLYVPHADRGKLKGSAPSLRGYGRGKSLAESLKGAVVDVRAAKGFSPLAVLNAAVQIDIGFRPLPVQLEEQGPILVTDPPLTPAHGVATRADGREVYCLPSDRLWADLDDVGDMLTHACQRAGLGDDAWFAGTRAVFAFETEAFVAVRPGVDPSPLVRGGEPGPLPEANPAAIEAALGNAARWLTTLLTPEGDVRGPDAGLDLEARARVGLAFARAAAVLDDKVLRAASEHVVGSLPNELPPGARAQLVLTHAALGADVAALGSHLAPLAAGDALGEREARVRASERPRPAGAVDLEAPPGVVEAALAGPAPPAASLMAWCEHTLQAPGPDSLRQLGVWARVARLDSGERAQALREQVRVASGDLLALQIRDAHRFLLRDPRTVGAFRARKESLEASPARTAEAVLALVEVYRMLVGR